MSWGIAETAPEIEKIKAESADYLHGLESCGEIDWDVYNYAFDFYMDLIQKAYELGKEEAQSERIKGHWIKISPANIYEYSEYDEVYGDRYCHYNGKAEVVDDFHYCRDGERRDE